MRRPDRDEQSIGTGMGLEKHVRAADERVPAIADCRATAPLRVRKKSSLADLIVR
jgi:hypothetical protein